MSVRQVIPAVLLISMASMALTVPVSSACDPSKEDCSTTPSALGVSPAASALGNTLPLNCLLPDNDLFSNALGVAENCPVMPVQVRAIKVAPTPVPTKVAALVQPKGDSPHAAMTVTDNWQTVEAGGVHWYKIDNGNNFFLDVWLDAYGRSGIVFAVYAPEQINGLNVDTQPKGRGAPVKADPSHDQWWKGSYAMGMWHILVRNYNTTPVQYKIGTKQSTTERKCVSYWEWLPTGQHVLWTDCGMYTDTSKLP